MLGAGGVVLLAASGCGGSGAHSASSASGTPTAPGATAVEKAGKLALEADPSGRLAYTTDRATATAGLVTISMRNMSGIMHNVAIQSGATGPVLGHTGFQSDGTSSFSVELKPGTYTFFCQAPGHRAAGMLGTLTVR
jgi:plastocyanin